VTYSTHYLQTQSKNVFLTTIGVATLRLSQHACTKHTQFKILVHGFFLILPQPSNILQSLKHANVIIMDEMSIMINTMLCAMKQ